MSAIDPGRLARALDLHVEVIDARTCPDCGTVEDDPYLSIRHDSEPFAERYPAWLVCRSCGRERAVGVYRRPVAERWTLEGSP